MARARRSANYVRTVFFAAAAMPVLCTIFAGEATAAKTCGYNWAVPGVYRISGNFRGTVESTRARLTTDCRITIQIPGVFTGGGVSRAGGCLRFSFKVQGEKQAFQATWCDTYGIVPWQGRNIRASVERINKEEESTPQKRNYNLTDSQ